jgi:hypothetical protein
MTQAFASCSMIDTLVSRDRTDSSLLHKWQGYVSGGEQTVHVKGPIREIFTDCVDAWDGETEWWAPLKDVDSSYIATGKLQRAWTRMNKEDRARWLLGQLWNCTDICPRDVADSLDIPCGTFASVVRRLAATDPPDAFAELIRRVERHQQQPQEERRALSTISSPA